MEAKKLNATRKIQLAKVTAGAKMVPGTSDGLSYTPNTKGTLAAELWSYVHSLNDIDTWYSIMMSTLVGMVLNSFVKFQRPRKTGFMRETLTFFLYEVLSPRIDAFVPRPASLDDINRTRYAAGPIGKTARRLRWAAHDNLVGEEFLFGEVLWQTALSLPALIVSMVIVDLGMGFKSDIMSLLHYLLVMFLVGVGRYAKNVVVTNNPGRQTAVEIYRRTMMLGLSYETVPVVTDGGGMPGQRYEGEAPQHDPLKSGFEGPSQGMPKSAGPEGGAAFGSGNA